MLLHKDDTKKTCWPIYRSLSTFELGCEFSVFLTADDTRIFAVLESRGSRKDGRRCGRKPWTARCNEGTSFSVNLNAESLAVPAHRSAVYSKSRRGRVLRQVLGCMSLPIVPTWCFPIYIRHFTELGIDSVTNARTRRSDK